MPFWEWNLWLSLGWILWKGLVPATPPPAPSVPVPAPTPPARALPPLRPTNPFSSTPAPPLPRSVSSTLPGGEAPAARAVSSPPASPGYAWVPSAAAGTYPAPNPGDAVWAALVDASGMTFDVLLSAEGIDEVGNFIGIVMNPGGAPVLGVGQALTVPIAAVAWIIPASGGASPAGATSGGGRKRLRG